MRYQRGKLDFEYDNSLIPNNPLTFVLYNGQDLIALVTNYLRFTNHNIGHPLRTSKRMVFFDSNIQTICHDVFDTIKIIKTQDNDDVLAAYLASRLFESFTGYWNQLLCDGKHLICIGLWQSVLKITHQWEASSGIKIHKGTPYFFLAETYLVMGDKDSGFVYLYNALEDDKKLPHLGYPKKAPAYFTAKMLDNPNNHMYHFLIREVRLKLSQYLNTFRNNHVNTFTLSDFDCKFLMKDELDDIAYFFTYNFFSIYFLDKNAEQNLLQNDFSKLKTLDLVFNLSLIVDEIIRYDARISGRTITRMNDSVFWLINKKTGMTQATFQNLRDVVFNVNDDPPDIVVPRLLTSIQQPAQGIQKEAYVLLLAYHLRNHAGHNISQQNVLTANYDEIIQQLMNSIFLSISEL